MNGEDVVKISLYERVALRRDLPEHGLKADEVLAIRSLATAS
jgi:hypothetical protein